MDTSLARAYMESEKSLSEFCNTELSKRIFFDGKTYHQDYDMFVSHEEILKTPVDAMELKLLQLANKLKENMTLFAQLEYLNRNISFEDTLAQLNLIIQQIGCLTKKVDIKNFIRKSSAVHCIRPLKMRSEDPILSLGFVIKCVVCYEYGAIFTDKIAAAVCHLFTKLCTDVGLVIVTGLLGNGDDYWDYDILEKVSEVGAIGVVSSFSNIETAVDVFVTSSQQAPWRLQRILVQECVYQKFKDTLKQKCDSKSKSKTNKGSVYAFDCLKYDEKEFLIDYLGNEDPQPSQVYVSAYRTSKELLSLLNEHQPHYLSLWANDVAEINEVAHNVHSPVVWLNNYADFRGPPAVSEAIFSHITFGIARQINVRKEKSCLLSALKQSWNKLDIENRREVLCNALKECAVVDDANDRIYKEIIEYLQNINPFTFVDVGKGYICLGISCPAYKNFYTSDLLHPIFFELVLYGNAFCIESKVSLQMVDILKKSGVPIAYMNDYGGEYLTRCEFDELEPFGYVCTRVIWTNIGNDSS